MRRMHSRLREALAVTRAEVGADAATAIIHGDLLVFCHGFCTALTGHHEGEDSHLFPAIAAAHPELEETLRALRQDHSMIGYLIGALQAAMATPVSAAEVGRHLDGISAIMESHFRYEERTLLTVLDSLALDADPDQVLGPL